MSQLSLFSFDKDNNFLKYKWESDYIKEICMEEDKILKFKNILTTKMVPDKKKIRFGVEVCVINEEGNMFDELFKFDKEQEAIDFFKERKEEIMFFLEINKKNKAFDGHRYFWDITSEGFSNPSWFSD